MAMFYLKGQENKKCRFKSSEPLRDNLSEIWNSSPRRPPAIHALIKIDAIDLSLQLACAFLHRSKYVKPTQDRDLSRHFAQQS